MPCLQWYAFCWIIFEKNLEAGAFYSLPREYIQEMGGNEARKPVSIYNQPFQAHNNKWQLTHD